MIFLKRFKCFIKTLRPGISHCIVPNFNNINYLPIGVYIYNSNNGWGNGIICKNGPKEMSLTIKEYPYGDYTVTRIEITIILRMMSYELQIVYNFGRDDIFDSKYTYDCIRKIYRTDHSVDIFQRQKTNKHDINRLMLKFLPLKDLSY